MSFNINDFSTSNELSENQLNQLNKIYVNKTINDVIYSNISFNGGINLNSSITTNNKIISDVELSQLDNISSNIQEKFNNTYSGNNTYTGLNSFQNDTSINNMIMTGTLTCNNENISPFEISYLNNVSSNIQSQLDNKINKISNAQNLSLPQMDISGNLNNNNNIIITNDISLNNVSSTILPSSNAIKQYIDNTINNLHLHQNIGMGSVNYYFTNNASNITNYEIISQIPDSNLDIETISVNNGEILLHSYITQNLNRTLINSGIWNFNIYCNVDDISSFSYFKFKLYTRTIAGIETLFLEGITNDINSVYPNVNEYICSTTLYNDVLLFSSDEIVVKVYFGTTLHKNVTARFYHGGDYNSYIQSSFLTKHNNLSGLNEGDYKHLTNQQYINATSISNNNTIGLLSNNDWNTFNNKQNNIIPGTTSQYYRGDKTFQNLDKNAVGLSDVDNVSDINKPISNLVQSALNLKQPIINNTVDVVCKSISDISGNLRTAINSLNINSFNGYYYVSNLTGDDTNNNGFSELKSFKTITKALSSQYVSSGCDIIIAPATYSENVTINSNNLTISSQIYEKGGIVNLTGNMNITSSSSSVRLSGLNLSNLTISGNCNVYIDNCKINSLLIQGIGYKEINSSSISGPIVIDSNCIINMLNANNIQTYITLTTNSPTAQLNLSNNLLCGFIQNNSSAVVGINNTPIYSASSSSYGITQTTNSVLYLTNCSILNPDNSNAKINIPINSFYSLNSVVFDRTNSILNGTVLTRRVFFDRLNCTNFDCSQINNTPANTLSYINNLSSDAQTQLNKKFDLSNNNTITTITTFNNSIISNGYTITNTQLGYLSNISSDIQNQLNNSVTLSTNQTISGNKTLTGNLIVGSNTLTPTILGYLSNISSDIQNQLNNSVSLSTNQTISGNKTLTGNLIVGSNTLTPTILGYLSGVNSNIQTQFDNTNLNIVKKNVTNFFNGDQYFEKIIVNSSIGEIFARDIKIDNKLDLYLNGYISFRIFSNYYYLYSTDLVNLTGTSNNVQLQLNNKLDISSNSTITINGSINCNNGSNNVSSTELSYLDGVTSNIQNQINSFPKTIRGTTVITVQNTNFGSNIILLKDILPGVTSTFFAPNFIYAIPTNADKGANLNYSPYCCVFSNNGQNINIQNYDRIEIYYACNTPGACRVNILVFYG
jgi:hypothetical protein